MLKKLLKSLIKNFDGKLIAGEYDNISIYNPLAGSSCIQFSEEFRLSRKGLINIQNKDNECFHWCHIRHLNPMAKYAQQIKRSDQEMLYVLIIKALSFLFYISILMYLDIKISMRVQFI